MPNTESPTFFIIPGFKEDATGPRYAWLRSAVRTRGFKPVPVPIAWDRRVMSDYIEDFLRCAREHAPRRAYVLGFSYGAVVAFCTANAVAAERVFLCSMSPEFTEDIAAIKPWIRRLVGTRRLADSRTRSATKIARALRVPSTLFYGTREAEKYPRLQYRSEETARLAVHSRCVVVPGSPHDIDFPAYREALARELAHCVKLRHRHAREKVVMNGLSDPSPPPVSGNSSR